ncbi:uncharacterized protein LOC117115185, partial [Anneissia japonica]|uniref:uncharacterized protein LOC117115185 n=1 Tax=Anneissia japonica TaxID=1529436 RepID=UPI001425B76B
MFVLCFCFIEVDIVKSLIETLPGNNDIRNKFKRLPLPSCIVVGNDAALPKAILDTFDVVIRVNDLSLPESRVDNDLGGKTTIQLVKSRGCCRKHQRFQVNSTIVFVAYRSVDIKHIVEIVKRRV